MEIAEGALAMTAKNKINTKIAGLAKPQTTKRTQKNKLKKHLPAHVATNVVIYVFVTVAFHPLPRDTTNNSSSGDNWLYMPGPRLSPGIV